MWGSFIWKVELIVNQEKWGDIFHNSPCENNWMFCFPQTQHESSACVKEFYKQEQY